MIPHRIRICVPVRVASPVKHLKDEYPLSAKFLKSINDGEEWILSTDVYRCEAPGRFVIGLLDHVKILQGEELKKYVQDYITNHFDAENKIIICC